MSLIDEVKSRTDIVQVVSEYADLDTSARNPKSRCPFHSERSPSFFVFPETGTWRCFGACATGGDAISFVMKQENMQFREALRLLADRAGVKYDEKENNSRPDETPKATVVEANVVAAKWFSQMLLSSTGSTGREYLADRGISTEVAARRGIGFAPGDGSLTLSSHLRSSRVEPSAAKDAKLVVQGQDKNWRDFFRNRITVEIHDRAGKVIAFGARSLDGSEPKYLNTPQTSVFDKSRVLYGLDWAADSIRHDHRAVVVEGYMDAITAHEHGFTNIVASMGTAVTPEQLRTLSQLASGGDQQGEVVLCLDSDAAGQEATLRALETAWHEFGAAIIGGSGKSGVKVMVATPVGGKDPDEAIRADSWAWRRSLDEATPLIEFIMRAYAARFGTEGGEGKARVVESVTPLIFAIANDFDRDAYWEKLAKLLDVSTERLKSMTPRPSSRGRTTSRASGRAGRGEKIATEQLGAVLSAGSAKGLEEYLLALALQREELREHVEAMPSEHFLDTANQQLFNAWIEFPKLSNDFDSFNQYAGAISPELEETVERLRSVPLPDSDTQRRIDEVTQCVRRLRERFLRHVLQAAEMALQEQEQTAEGEERELLRNKTLDPSDLLRKVFEAGATGRR